MSRALATLSFSIGIIKVRQARGTENRIMWGLLKKSRTAQFTPWRAIPAIAAEKITMPLGIMRFLGTVCRSIKNQPPEKGGCYIEITKNSNS